MNHIKKLQQENEMLKDCLVELETYLSSSKFAENVMVNKSDILLRIKETRNAMFQAGLNSY